MVVEYFSNVDSVKMEKVIIKSDRQASLRTNQEKVTDRRRKTMGTRELKFVFYVLFFINVTTGAGIIVIFVYSLPTLIQTGMA